MFNNGLSRKKNPLICSIRSFYNRNIPSRAGSKLPRAIIEHRVERWSELAPADHWDHVGERAKRKVKVQKDTVEWLIAFPEVREGKLN